MSGFYWTGTLSIGKSNIAFRKSVGSSVNKLPSPASGGNWDRDWCPYLWDYHIPGKNTFDISGILVVAEILVEVVAMYYPE